MKQINLTILLTMLLSMMGVKVFSYNIAVKNADGVTICYNYINNYTELEVTYRDKSVGYVGNIVIPESVTYNGRTYSVTSISSDAFSGCSGLTSVTIPNSVTSIGNGVFYDCSSLTSVTIPNSVTSIGSSAFSGCSGLTSVTIPNSVTNIGGYAFRNCSGLTSVTIGNSVMSIGNDAFSRCSGLKKVIVKDIAAWCGISFSGSSSNPLYYAEHLYSDEDTEITELVIPDGVTSIGSFAFYGCGGLTSVTIGNSVTSIGNYAFYGCSGLTSVTIGNSVTSIGYNAFGYCTGLNKVIAKDIAAWCGISFSGSSSNPLYYAEHLYSDEDTEITELVIPNDVTSIGNLAFYGCSGLSSITIPNSVISIGNAAFDGCSSLTEMTIPNSVISIGNSAFDGCSSLAEVTIENGETTLSMGYSNVGSNGLFHDCPITTIYIGRNLSYSASGSYGYSPFYGIRTIKELTIANSVTSIGNYLFDRCTGLDCIICDNETPPTIASSSFPSHKSNIIAIVPPSVLSKYKSATIWKDMRLNVPFTVVSTTQTTVTLRPLDIVSDAYIKLNGEKFTPSTDGNITVTGLSPNHYYQISTSARYKDYSLEGSIYATTMTVTPYINLVSSTNLTLTLRGSYNAGDATVVRTTLAGRTGVNETTVTGLQPGKEYSYTYYVTTADGSTFSATKSFSTWPVELHANATTTATHCELTGNYEVIDAIVKECGFTGHPKQKTVKITGLDPSHTYTTTFYVETEDGSRFTQDIEYTTKEDLRLQTSQPKVVSVGNVIVAAETNLDDEETNVGFEWRRTDWTDDFASNTGAAYLYNGTMEGYIRNLNTEKLWKYRPYYLSNSGTYYYGDWVGLDPTNTSYFEPTVHTYATITIEGNTALVKGYALGGTDKVTVQGFKYWKSVAGARGMGDVTSIPSDAMTVEASGQVMTASLTGLDYNATYHYVAFVTTSEGETFYGEEQVFSTEGDPTGIEGVHSDASNPATIVARYNIRGERITTPQEGVNILLMSDGSTKKIWVRKR